MSAERHPHLPPSAVGALCAIILLGAGLRIYALDHQSLWSDEIFSLAVTDPTLTFAHFWDRVLADTHPPLYYMLLRFSSTLLGQSEIAARTPSVIFGVLTLCAAAILPGSTVSRSCRLALPLLLAVSPGAVWYAREARSYALLLLLSTAITLACIRFVRCPAHEDRVARSEIAMLAVAAILASFTHYFGFLIALAAFLTCLVLTNRERRGIVLLAGSGVVALFAPWVAYHSQSMDVGRAVWIGELPVVASIGWFAYLSFGGSASIGLFIGTAGAVLAAGGGRRLAASRSTIWACVLLCLLTLAMAAVISLHRPILTSRNMIVVLPALYLIAAQLTANMVTRWGKLAAVTYLAAQVGLMSQPLAANYTSDINDQWRDSAALVLNMEGCESGAVRVYGDASNYRFFTGSVRPDLHMIEIPEGGAADLGNEPLTSCAIVLWVVGVAPWDLDDLMARLELSRSSLQVVEYHNAFVLLRKPP